MNHLFNKRGKNKLKLRNKLKKKIKYICSFKHKRKNNYNWLKMKDNKKNKDILQPNKILGNKFKNIR
jgi:hypothetical protein